MNNPKYSATRYAGRTILVFLFFCVTGLIIYANTFQSPFIFDDRGNISENPHIRITKISLQSLEDVFNSPLNRRPIANLSFALNYYAHQYEPAGYHLLNLLIHVVTSLLVFLIARQTLRYCQIESFAIPFFSALLWLVNPVHTQSVTYIVQRMNSLSAMFYLLALFCYIRARQSQSEGYGLRSTLSLLTVSVFSGGLALATKEIAATLPIVIFLYEWYFFQHLSKVWLKKQLRWVGPLALTMLILLLIYSGKNPLKIIQGTYQEQNFSPEQRLLTEPRVIIYYLSLLIFPHPARLNLNYDFPLSQGLTDPLSTLLSLLALLSMTGSAAYLARKNRIVSFAIAWFLSNLVIESSFLGLALIYEHRTYLPSIFLFIAGVKILFRYSRSKKTLTGFLVIAIIVSGSWTYQRNHAWQNRIRFWKDNVAKAPHYARPYCNLGFSLISQNRNAEAIYYLSQALKIDPLHKDSRNNLAVAYLSKGQLDKARYHCRKILDHDPDFYKAQNTMGFIHLSQKNMEQAISCFQKVLKNHPDVFETNMNLGIAYLQQDKPRQAMVFLQKATDLKPTNGEARFHLGQSLARSGNYSEAIIHLQKALTLSSAGVNARKTLANIYMTQGKIDQAINHYRQVLKVNPADAAVNRNLARSLQLKGQTEKAITFLKKALKILPEDTVLLLQLSSLLSETGRYLEAAAQLEKVNHLMPAKPKITYNLACLYAKANDPKKAVATLKKAVDNGYDNWAHLKNDQDLKNIHDTDYYRKLTHKK